MTRATLTRGAHSIKMLDGTVYRARGDLRGGGTVDIDNPRHAKEVKAMGKVESTVSVGVFHASTKAPGRDCTLCPFSGYAFHITCPKCGAPMGDIK